MQQDRPKIMPPTADLMPYGVQPVFVPQAIMTPIQNAQNIIPSNQPYEP